MQNVLGIVTGLYVKIKLFESATRAQLEALPFIANGYRHADAVKKLRYLKARLTAARHKLFVRTTAEAIQRVKDCCLL